MRSRVARGLGQLGQTPPWAIDAVLGTAIVVLGLLSTSAKTAPDRGVTYHQRDSLAYGLILTATLPYYVRRRAPVAVFAVSSIAVSALYLGHYNAGALSFALLLGAYTVAAYRPARDVVGCAALFAFLLMFLFVEAGPLFTAGDLLGSIVGFGGAMFVGWAMQSRRARIDGFEDEQEIASLRAAADERLRIAQELHDIVAHSLGVIAVQSGVGIRVIDSDPDEARRSLENISRASRSSLAEIRRLLGVLRSPDGTPAYTPAPGFSDLSKLVSEVADAGLPVDVTIDVDTTRVPPSVGLAAYRIVQEALTNALRHANANRATVHVDGTDGLLNVEVTDDGRGANGGTKSGGHGLVGMRERVAVHGGSLSTGPGSDGGFRVTAALPYDVEEHT